jgi:hypothetical protein
MANLQSIGRRKQLRIDRRCNAPDNADTVDAIPAATADP